MDEFLRRVGDVEQRIAGRRHFGEAAAEQHHEIGLLDLLGQRRVDADADIARVGGAQMIEQHLAAEGTANGQLVVFRKCLEACDAFLGPACAADDEDRALRLAKHFCEGGHL